MVEEFELAVMARALVLATLVVVTADLGEVLSVEGEVVEELGMRIPAQTGQRFRTKLDTDSGPKWAVTAVADRPRSRCSPDRFGGSDPRS